jgi:hypothetical protein
VFWNGSKASVDEIRAGSERPYNWCIGPVGQDFIVAEHRNGKGSLPLKIEHQGIHIEKDTTAETMYYYGGKWVTLSNVVTKIY